MATNIFLGEPPAKIKEFILKHYGPSEPDMTKVPLHFTANEDNSTVSLVCYDDYGYADFTDSWCEFQYSTDGMKSWKDYPKEAYSEEAKIKLDDCENKTVYFIAKQGNVEENPNLNGFGYYDENEDVVTKYHYFVMEGSIKADGNIQFLLENTGTKMDVPKYCYQFMFQECTSLTQAPELPATTLADWCYSSMFVACTSLTHVPALPAKTLTDFCYAYMFFGCTNLNNINVNFSAWNPSNATASWVKGVSSSGTFTCPSIIPEEFGNNRIPTGWTVVHK